MDIIKQKLNHIPLSPGCYLFLNKRGNIIYIGKSKALRNRIRQHLTAPPKDQKHEHFKREIWDISIIETESEAEALILECELIKKHQPKYNSLMTRNKTFPFIRVDKTAEYPTISITEQIIDDGSEYFGCFHNKESAERIIELANRIWATPLCGKTVFPKNHRPCLNYHLGKCSGACAGIIDKKLYQNQIKELLDCFKGKHQNIIKRLNSQMKQSAENMEYEKAAKLRDIIGDLKLLSKRIKRFNANLKNSDIFLFFSAFGENSYILFFLRDGVVLGKMRFNEKSLFDEALLSRFLEDIYNKRLSAPLDVSARNLLEISADKYFITAPKNWKPDRIIRILKKSHEEYIHKKP